MPNRLLRPAVVLAFAALAPSVAFAQANVMKECGAEYQTAKAANTLGGKKWQEFLSECRTRHAAATTPAAATAPAAVTAPAAAPAAPPVAKATAPAAPASASAAVFPKAIDPKYSTLKPAKQRMQTCLDQYKANKAANGNGGLRWIEKGGGYYSQCNAALKNV